MGPGSIAAYSNLGFDLLGAALAEAAGTSYPDLLRERITGPLGMADTGLAPSKGAMGPADDRLCVALNISRSTIFRERRDQPSPRSFGHEQPLA